MKPIAIQRTVSAGVLLLVGVCAAVLAGDSAAPSAGFRLQNKLSPGTELTCDFTSVMKQTMTESGGGEVTHELRLDGRMWQIVADVDKEGTVLMGWFGRSRWVAPAGEASTNDVARDQVWLSAYRVDRQGRSVPRTSSIAGSAKHALRRVVDIIGENSQLCAPFPDRDLTVGSSWKGNVLLPTPGTRQPGTAVSTITALNDTGTRRLCTIRSDVTSKGEQSLTTWKPDVTRPDIAVSGFTEGRFDLDRGVWVEMKANLASKFEGRTGDHGYSGVIVLTSTMTLESMRQMPDEEFTEKVAKVRLLDQAMSRLYGGDFPGVLTDLKQQQEKDPDPSWKEGWKMVVQLVEHAETESAKLSSVDRTLPATPAGSNVVTVAASDITAVATLRKANELAREGKLQESVSEYGRFLAEAPPDTEPGLRVLAQYRLAVMQEKLGDRAAARASFATAAALRADDDYSVKLKAKAEQKAAELMEPAP